MRLIRQYPERSNRRYKLHILKTPTETACGRRVGLMLSQGGRWDPADAGDRATNCNSCMRTNLGVRNGGAS